MPTLLIVDDDDDTLTSLKSIVERSMPGTHVVTAHSAAQALTIIGSEPIDLMLTDYKLGATSGLDLIHNVQTPGHEIPSILISGHNDLGLVISAANEPAVKGLVGKPFDLENLLARIRKQLG
jgi:DNA-binding NtrC family response regulator